MTSEELERAAGNLAGLARDLERYDPWGGTRSRSDAADLRLILAANRKMAEALAASPSVGGRGEPVAWRVRGPRGGWMHSDKLPSSWRNAEPLYAVPPPVSTGSRPQEAVPTEWSERPEVVLQYAQQVATFAAKRVGCVDEWRPLGDVYGCLTQIDNCLTGLTATPQPADGCSRNEGAE